MGQCESGVYHSALSHSTTSSLFNSCRLIWRGYRRPLQYSDLWGLNPDDRSSYITPKFEKEWQKEVKRAK